GSCNVCFRPVLGGTTNRVVCSHTPEELISRTTGRAAGQPSSHAGPARYGSIGLGWFGLAIVGRKQSRWLHMNREIAGCEWIPLADVFVISNFRRPHPEDDEIAQTLRAFPLFLDRQCCGAKPAA